MDEPKRTRRTRNTPQTVMDQIVDSSKAPAEQRESIVGPDPRSITSDRLIDSGSTLINCACSDNPEGAFALGTINTFPGKSQSGKTVLMLTMLAMCASDPRFNDYDLIMDDSEETVGGFDLEYLFEPVVGRMIYPKYDGDIPRPSETIQDFKANVLTRCKSKKPFIYVLDGLDALTSDEELEREYHNALKKAGNKTQAEELKKSYHTEKAKHIGEALRMINGMIKRSDSALMFTQQTRQNINPNWGEAEWTTSGGEAPFFYSFHRVYLSTGPARTAESHNIKHKIGSVTRAEIVKNKLTGKRRKSGIEFDIYEDLGIDDVASCVDFLKKTGYWKTDGGWTKAPEILGADGKMQRMDLIRFIEKECAQSELRKIVGKMWKIIEEDIRLTDRARRF